MRYVTTALSLAALLSTGCAKPYIQNQVGYAKGHHKIGKDGYVDLVCVRTRGGATVSEKHEFRFGADVCYGKLPKTTSKKKYSVNVPVVGKQEADVDGMTKNNLVKINFPFIEYRLGALETNFPSQVPADLGIRSPIAKDFSMSIWIAAGYDLEILASETNYTTSGGTVDNIPGIDIKGQFYTEVGHEMIFFGKVPVTLGIKVPEDGNVGFIAGSGYKLQWGK
ncbi:MAG: hypothetical protein Q8R47_02945 [Nanoarchaeota archaeon]|nr:hypothetical protein [Nanoarchaeota archaeon]